MLWQVKLNGNVSQPMEEDAVCRLLRAGVVDVQVRPDTPGASWKPVEDWRQFQAALAPSAAGRAWDTAGKTGGGAAAQKEARDEAAAAEGRRVELVRRDRDQRLTEEAERLLAPHKERVATFVEIAFTKGARSSRSFALAASLRVPMSVASGGAGGVRGMRSQAVVKTRMRGLPGKAASTLSFPRSPKPS